MDADVREAIFALAAAEGFSLAVEYCTGDEMVLGIRQVNALLLEQSLTTLQASALMENVRRVIITTIGIGFIPSIEAQSRLPRWRRLSEASPEAARAYAAVLGYLGVDVPECLYGDEAG